MTEILYIVVHCAMTPNGSDRYSAEQIDNWHRANGWFRKRWWWNVLRRARTLKHIGYHAVIEAWGRVTPARSVKRKEKGCHTKGFNSKSIAVCMIGGKSVDGIARYRPAQWHSLARVVRGWTELHPDAKVVGHSDLDRSNRKKNCPGFNVDAWAAGGMVPPEGHIYHN